MTIPNASDWRSIGDVPLDVITAILRERRSPMLSTAAATHEAAKPHTALFWAQAGFENQWQTTGIILGPEDHNPVALRPERHDDKGPYGAYVITAPDGGQFLAFSTDADCAREWKRRITSDTYKAGTYARTTTLASYLAVYAPGQDRHPVTGVVNADARYLDTVTDLLRRFAEAEASTEVTDMAYKAHAFPGLSRPVYLPADIKVSIEIVPSSRTNIRSNAKRSASVVRFMTQHETANFAAGANARMHRNWLHSGASGAYVGFNAVNDDREVIVLTPYDEVTWAAGTATGNLTGDHHELCVNAGIDHVKARRIAAALAAGVLYARGLPVSSLIQHNYWTGKDCPYLLRREGRWAPYVAKVTEFYNGIKAQVEGGAKPEPQKPEYATAEKIAAVADNRPFVALDNKSILVRADVIVRATKSTPRLKYATPKSEHIGPMIGAGETFAVDYLIVNPDQSLYWYTPWGTRVAFADTEIVEAEDVADTLASVLSAAVES